MHEEIHGANAHHFHFVRFQELPYNLHLCRSRRKPVRYLVAGQEVPKLRRRRIIELTRQGIQSRPVTRVEPEAELDYLRRVHGSDVFGRRYIIRRVMRYESSGGSKAL